MAILVTTGKAQRQPASQSPLKPNKLLSTFFIPPMHVQEFEMRQRDTRIEDGGLWSHCNRRTTGRIASRQVYERPEFGLFCYPGSCLRRVSLAFVFVLWPLRCVALGSLRRALSLFRYCKSFLPSLSCCPLTLEHHRLCFVMFCLCVVCGMHASAYLLSSTRSVYCLRALCQSLSVH